MAIIKQIFFLKVLLKLTNSTFNFFTKFLIYYQRKKKNSEIVKYLN